VSDRLEVINSLLKLTVQTENLACPVCAIRQTNLDERARAIELCKNEGIGFDWHLASALYNDPVDFYQMLYDNRDRQILIIDHAERLFSDTTLVSVMRQASEFQSERTIYHPDLIQSFQTKCRYILFSEVGVADNLPFTSENLRPFVHGLFDRGCAPFI
jgi:hypothetical protein